MSGFFGALLKGKELHIFETAQLSGFGFPSVEKPSI